MLKIIIIIIVVLTATLFWINQAPTNRERFTEQLLPAKQLRPFMQRKVSLHDHPCINRSRCLVLYLSPWCPSCKNTRKFVPFVQQAISSNDDTGFIVVVGSAWGNFKGGYNMARDIGGQIYIDEESNYWQEIRSEVNAIPAWLVFESDGDVSETETGSPRSHNLASAKSFLSKLSID